MLGLYLGALVFGTILLAVSLVLGGDDVEGEVETDDLDGDAKIAGGLGDDPHGLEGNLGGELWRTFLSMRFVTFFAFAFGLTGALLTWLAVPAVVTAALALAFGGVLGGSVASAFRRIRDDSVSGETGLDRFVGDEARVLLDVRPDGTGKICIETLAGRVEILARTRDTRPIPRGQRVLVAGIQDGIADVTALTPTPTDEGRQSAGGGRSAVVPGADAR